MGLSVTKPPGFESWDRPVSSSYRRLGQALSLLIICSGVCSLSAISPFSAAQD